MPTSKDRALRRAMLVLALLAVCVALYAAVSVVQSPPDATGRTADDGRRTGNDHDGTRPSLSSQVPGEPSLAGRLVDSAGVAIVGTSVSALEELAAPSRDAPGAADAAPTGGLVIGARVAATETDSEGRFAIAGLPPGPYRIRIEGAGVITSEVRFVTAPELDLEIAAQREIELRGRVESMPGVAPAWPVVVHARGESQEVTASLADDGTFAFRGLPEGVYRIWADAGTLGTSAARVEARGAGPFPPLELTMTPAIIARGRLVDRETGRPLPGLVVFTHDGPEPEHTAIVSPDGVFAIGGLLPGRWYADASSPGYVPAEQLAFEADRSRELELGVSRGGAIEGLALDPSDDPVAGALIEAVSRDVVGAGATARISLAPAAVTSGAQTFIPRGELGVLLGPVPFPPAQPTLHARVAQPIAATATFDPGASSSVRLSDPEGRFRIAGLRAGTYQVKATHPDLAGGVSPEVRVTLGNTVTNVRVVLRRGVRVVGSVKDASGAPILAASVSAMTPGNPPMTVSTNAAGEFALPPLLGSAAITASAPGYAGAHRTSPVAADGAEVKMSFTLERADKSIVGRVQDSAGFPLRGARVTVAGQAAGGGISDESGRFEIANLAGGEHTVAVAHPDFPPHTAVLETGDSAFITLPLGGGIAGEVRDARTLSSIGSVALELTATGHAAMLLSSNADGSFEIVPLAAGRWTLVAVAPSYAPRRQILEVPAGRSPGQITVKRLVLELARGALLAGTVRDENGERVVGARVSVKTSGAGPIVTTTDIDGRFTLTDVPADGATVIDIVAGDRSGRSELDLRPGDERRTLELRIGPT